MILYNDTDVFIKIRNIAKNYECFFDMTNVSYTIDKSFITFNYRFQYLNYLLFYQQIVILWNISWTDIKMYTYGISKKICLQN